MAKMGLYCKAYPVERFQEYGRWKELAKAVPTASQPDGDPATPQAEEDKLRGRFLFLQENFTVTESIFLDEQVVFDEVTDEWKDFCRDVLEFEIPADRAAASAQTPQPESDSAS